MKFELGEKVRVKATGREGEVKAYKQDIYFLHGKETNVIQYCVNFGSYINDWHKEENLESVNVCEFTDKFELGLLNMLIDIYLKHNKFDMIKQLHNEKQLYMR